MEGWLEWGWNEGLQRQDDGAGGIVDGCWLVLKWDAGCRVCRSDSRGVEWKLGKYARYR